MATARPHRYGATLRDDGVRFEVWAPRAERVEVLRDDAVVGVLDARDGGDFVGHVAGLGAGDRYRFRVQLDDGETHDLADPAARWLPDGVHGPAAVDDPDGFVWTDDGWTAPSRQHLVIYELHIGTFTPDGTLDAAIDRLDDLAEDGVTAIELMPVAQFAGARNWGYDGVFLHAVHDTYGGPDALRRFVDAAHARGLAVLLDVVYNHVGPEGNVLGHFGPFFGKGQNPWGAGLNTDGPGSDAVRRFVVEAGEQWIRDFHLDGLRLDAVHAIHDSRPVHVLAEMGAACHAVAARQDRRIHLVAESDLGDAKLVRPVDHGGWGLDLVWDDDVHHVLHTQVTGEGDGWYVDFDGFAQLPELLRDRYVYADRWSPFRERHVGAPARDQPFDRFVACLQNHDQVGNRPAGDRLTATVAAGRLRAATTWLLLAPFTPMVFMGEEYGETAPFPYFVSHTEEDLIAAVRKGRREEFAFFDSWDGEVPDPQAPATHASAILDWSRRTGDGAPRLRLQRDLLALRRSVLAVCDPAAAEPVAVVDGPTVVQHRVGPDGRDAVAVLVNLDTSSRDLLPPEPPPGLAPWTIVLDSENPRYGGDADPLTAGDGPLRLTPDRAVVLTTKALG